MSGAKRFTAKIDAPGRRPPIMAPKGLNVTIVGAGVAGLATAATLGRAGARVLVVEQSPSIQEVGAGLQISPNGAVVLRALGLGKALGLRASPSQAVELRDGPTDRLVARLDLGARGPGMVSHVIHRADLIEILADAAMTAGVQIKLGARVATVDLGPEGARLRLMDGTEIAPDLLIGADGLRSAVRQAVDGPSKPFFTGQVAWRALIACNAGAPAQAEVHMGAGRHLVTYPLARAGMRNLIAVQERAQWVQEDWALRDDPANLRRAFDDFGPRVRGWLEAVQQPGLWGLFRHEVAQNWVWSAPCAPSRGAVILGDAAHATLPFLAQGANMALEDAYVLARCLGGIGDRPRDLDDALRAFEAARRPRCARIVAASTSAARIYHLGTPLRGVVHMGMRIASRAMPGAILGRYDWIHRHDVTAPPTTH